MSKDNWMAIGAGFAVVLLVTVYGTIDPFERPETAPDSVLPLGSFDGSGAFVDSLTASSSLAASPSFATTKPSAAKATTSPKIAPVVSTTPDVAPGLPLALGRLRDSLVNIICASKDNSVRSISGSGVVISSSGLILTNAHIAQFFLLRDYPKTGNVVCVVRSGNPAHNSYLAELAYISKPWVTANPSTLVSKTPRGTGENDFALLAITKSVTDQPLPTSFTHVELADEEPYVGEPVAIGSYGAQALTADQIQNRLYQSLVFAKVMDRFTFVSTTVDVLSLGGSVVAQQGSSGGGVVNASGKLIALISTSSIEGALSSRDLHAITINHVRRSFADDRGGSFDAYVRDKDTVSLVTDFVSSARSLSTLLTSALAASK